jgi:hypothetical protein
LANDSLSEGEGQGEAGLVLKWLLTLIPFCQADAVADKADQKRKCLSASEFLRFSPWQSLRRVPAQRAQGTGSPSFAYFSWRRKKSERLPGRTRLDRSKT